MSRVILILLLFCNVVMAEVETGVATIYSIHPTHGTITQGTCFVSGEKEDTYKITTAAHVIPENNPTIVKYIAIFHEPSWEAYIISPLDVNINNDIASFAMKKTDNIQRYVFKIQPQYKFTNLERLISYTVSPKDALNAKIFKYLSEPSPGVVSVRGLVGKGNSGAPVLNAKNECVGVVSEFAVAGHIVIRRPVGQSRVVSLLPED